MYVLPIFHFVFYILLRNIYFIWTPYKPLINQRLHGPNRAGLYQEFGSHSAKLKDPFLGWLVVYTQAVHYGHVLTAIFIYNPHYTK